MSWVDGLAEWVEGDTAYLSVAFTWRLDDAYMRAIWLRGLGYHVKAGGPAIYMLPDYLEGVAELPPMPRDAKGTLIRSPGNLPDTVWRHNADATVASRGCDVGCSFCIVPAMEGKTFTPLPDFPVRPILCDNNLSALSADYQEHIVRRYEAEGVELRDANSGFEPRTFDDDVFARWKRINRGPWRFAYDDQAEREPVKRVFAMLRRHHVGQRRIQVYTLIGNEPFAACMERVAEVIAWGGEPYAQPVMKLNALDYRPWVRFDWNEPLLKRVQRWVNGRFWKFTDFEHYNASAKTDRNTQTESFL